jgi:hypothetical protein
MQVSISLFICAGGMECEWPTDSMGHSIFIVSNSASTCVLLFLFIYLLSKRNLLDVLLIESVMELNVPLLSPLHLPQLPMAIFGFCRNWKIRGDGEATNRKETYSLIRQTVLRVQVILYCKYSAPTWLVDIYSCHGNSGW